MNGDFDQSGQGVWGGGYPDGHFTSEYLARPFEWGNPGYLGDKGSYTIGGNPSQNHGQFRNISDHGGDGYMMIVNGSDRDNVSVWQSESITITPGTTYQFTGYVTNVNGHESWDLWRSTQTILGASISLNGGTNWQDLGTVANLVIAADPNAWIPFSVTWFNRTNTSVILRLDDHQTATDGNDFAIDTLKFQAIPEPTTMLLFGASGLFCLLYRWRRRTATR